MQSNQGNVNGKSRARYLNEVSIARHPAPDVCVCVCVWGGVIRFKDSASRRGRWHSRARDIFK